MNMECIYTERETAVVLLWAALVFLISIYTYFIEWQTSFSLKMVPSWKRIYIFNAWILKIEIECWKPIALSMIHVRLLYIINYRENTNVFYRA